MKTLLAALLIILVTQPHAEQTSIDNCKKTFFFTESEALGNNSLAGILRDGVAKKLYSKYRNAPQGTASLIDSEINRYMEENYLHMPWIKSWIEKYSEEQFCFHSAVLLGLNENPQSANNLTPENLGEIITRMTQDEDVKRESIEWGLSMLLAVDDIVKGKLLENR